MRSNDVISTSFRRHVPTRFLINQAQIIAFFILKSYIITNSRIELRGIVYRYFQIKLKLHLLFDPSAWYFCDFFLFHIEIEGKCGWIIGGGGQRVCWPPLKLLGGGGAAPPPPLLFLRLCYYLSSLLALKAPNKNPKIAADDILFFYLYISKKIRLDFSCETSSLMFSEKQ